MAIYIGNNIVTNDATANDAIMASAARFWTGNPSCTDDITVFVTPFPAPILRIRYMLASMNTTNYIGLRISNIELPPRIGGRGNADGAWIANAKRELSYRNRGFFPTWFPNTIQNDTNSEDTDSFLLNKSAIRHFYDLAFPANYEPVGIAAIFFVDNVLSIQEILENSRRDDIVPPRTRRDENFEIPQDRNSSAMPPPTPPRNTVFFSVFRFVGRRTTFPPSGRVLRNEIELPNDSGGGDGAIAGARIPS